jgi:aminoglycoside phosphotransferase (APT) family kinase protein
MPGLLGCDFAGQGLMTEQEFLETYAKAVGRDDIPDFTFFLALSLFRLVGIAQGVYARALAGNAADRSAVRLGEVAKGAAMLGWQIAQGG